MNKTVCTFYARKGKILKAIENVNQTSIDEGKEEKQMIEIISCTDKGRDMVSITLNATGSDYFWLGNYYRV